MAECPEARPSFEQVSGLLADVPQDRLISLNHKLSHVRRGTRSCKLLQAIILLTLRRQAEAREILDTLGDDVAAAHLCRSHWGSMQVGGVQPPKEQPQVAQALAQIYSLLAEENLCCPEARDEAYRAAIQTLHCSNRVHSTMLESFLAEAQDKCGLDFAIKATSSEFNTLKSSPEKFQRSIPVPINGSVPPGQPLCSTGSPISSVSHFEISQSPTVLYLTHTAGRFGDLKVSKLCGSTASSLAQSGEGRIGPGSPAVSHSQSPGMQDQLYSRDDFAGDCLDLLVSSGKEDALPLATSVRTPVECTEPPNIIPAELQDLKEGTGSNLQASSSLQGDPATKGDSHTPLEDSRSLSQNTDPKSTPSSMDVPPATFSSSTDPQDDEDQFFMFVVVHAVEDETIAYRVKDRLEELGVSNGATFGEDFLVPGHNQLACFQDALDNSAFTILLLTKNYNSRLCAFQTDMALMDSFTQVLKCHSVIPFVPQEKPLNDKMPIVLVGLVPLDENSPFFEEKVKKKFKLSKFRRMKASWSLRQQIRQQKRLNEQFQDYQQMQQRLLALSLQSGYAAQMPFPPVPVGFPGPYHIPLTNAPPPFPPPPRFSAPGMFQPQPGPGQASPSQPFSIPTLMPQGPQPHLIIQNAQMVQIGDYDHMQFERTNMVLDAAEGEGEVNESLGTAVGSRNED